MLDYKHTTNIMIVLWDYKVTKIILLIRRTKHNTNILFIEL